MASPIDYIIHPDPQQPQKPGHPASGTHNSLFVTSGPASASPSTARAGPAHHTQTHSGGQNQTQALYQCAECLRRYSRPEHLQRHIASHTLGKRFTCDVCFKGFARADLLKRHRSNHQDGNGNKRKRFNSAPSASRVGQACTACAKSRVKCEDVKPCTRCKNRGLACEVASEDPTVHSIQPSEHRTGHTESTPDSCCSLSSGAGPPQRLFPAAPAPPSYVGSTSPEDSKQGIVPLPYTAYKEPEVYTPEASSVTAAQHLPNNLHAYSSNSVRYAGHEHASSPFPDFLCDLLYEQPLGNPSRLPDAQGALALDFYDDAALDFNEFDFNLLNWNLDATQVTPDDTASAEDPVGMAEMRSTLDKLWTESPWRWTPGKTDNCYTEQSNLPLPSNDAHSPQTRHDGAAGGWAANETLRASCRDKILAIVLGTCRESRMANRVASSFPSADTMDSWINIFMAAHMSQVASWIHYGSFSLNSQWPEWLAVAAAAGAVLTPVPAFRRFGLALQEAIRIAIPERVGCGQSLFRTKALSSLKLA
ncbi:hypothetical protein F5144DRAFT_60546 [Chaetomium tenue]|uniref:Uncharacterized protein n=1 Tax=Chaetomium tenue TaxID=1854479 RepID=A0ACB7PR52_9PEZI|nr:hypothetical protein F5144DRAFT_60546 [Chaetomium globosum]